MMESTSWPIKEKFACVSIAEDFEIEPSSWKIKSVARFVMVSDKVCLSGVRSSAILVAEAGIDKRIAKSNATKANDLVLLFKKTHFLSGTSNSKWTVLVVYEPSNAYRRGRVIPYRKSVRISFGDFNFLVYTPTGYGNIVENTA